MPSNPRGAKGEGAERVGRKRRRLDAKGADTMIIDTVMIN
jgi:hypothetical protein